MGGKSGGFTRKCGLLSTSESESSVRQMPKGAVGPRLGMPVPRCVCVGLSVGGVGYEGVGGEGLA